MQAPAQSRPPFFGLTGSTLSFLEPLSWGHFVDLQIVSRFNSPPWVFSYCLCWQRRVVGKKDMKCIFMHLLNSKFVKAWYENKLGSSISWQNEAGRLAWVSLLVPQSLAFIIGFSICETSKLWLSWLRLFTWSLCRMRSWPIFVHTEQPPVYFYCTPAGIPKSFCNMLPEGRAWFSISPSAKWQKF